MRPESKEAVDALHALGVQVVMITGDAEPVARTVAAQLGIDRVYAGVRPEDKAAKVQELQHEGLSVAMVGDGVNDAPALAQADVGIAIGAGTDVAIASAGVILASSDPRSVISVIELSRASYRKMQQNLWWAAGYNLIAVPLAAGVLAPIGFVLPMSVGAILMSLSTVIVALNAQLLRRLDLRPEASTRAVLQRAGPAPRMHRSRRPASPPDQRASARESRSGAAGRSRGRAQVGHGSTSASAARPGRRRPLGRHDEHRVRRGEAAQHRGAGVRGRRRDAVAHRDRHEPRGVRPALEPDRERHGRRPRSVAGPRLEQRAADGEEAEHRGERIARQPQDEPVRRASEEGRAAGAHRDRRHEELGAEVARRGADPVDVRVTGAARRHDQVDRVRGDRGPGRLGVVAHAVDRGDVGTELGEDRRQRDAEAVPHPPRHRDAGLDDLVAREHERDAGTTPHRQPVGARRRGERHARRGQQDAGLEHDLVRGRLGAGRSDVAMLGDIPPTRLADRLEPVAGDPCPPRREGRRRRTPERDLR